MNLRELALHIILKIKMIITLCSRSKLQGVCKYDGAYQAKTRKLPFCIERRQKKRLEGHPRRFFDAQIGIFCLFLSLGISEEIRMQRNFKVISCIIVDS